MSKRELTPNRATWRDYYYVLVGIFALAFGLIISYRAVLMALEGTFAPLAFITGAAFLGFAFFRLKAVCDTLKHWS